jgi:hypothetical protein
LADGPVELGTPGDRYAALVTRMLREPDVTFGADNASSRRAFGADALKVDGRIFAMVARGRLVVKLPRGRVDALVAAGEGDLFGPGHGRLMKEWLALDPGSDQDWDALANEALIYVGRRR